MQRKKTILNLIVIAILAFSFSFNALAIGLEDSDTFLNIAADNSGFDLSKKDTEPVIASIVKALISFLGVIFFLLVIYGGFMWMTAQGNDEQVARAKKIIINSTIGLVVIMLAYAITWFIVYEITESTGFQQT